VTAQFVTSEGGQIPAAEKFRIYDLVLLGETMQERRCGVSPTAAEHVGFQEQILTRYLWLRTITFFAIGLDRRGDGSGGEGSTAHPAAAKPNNHLIESKLKQLRTTDRISIGDFRVLTEIQAFCEECETRCDVDDLLSRGSCACSIER